MSDDREELEANALAVLDVDGKMQLLRAGADARAHREEAREALADADRGYSAAYAAMVRGGWTEAQLAKLGFDEPVVSPKGRSRRRRNAGAPARSTAAAGVAGESGTSSSASPSPTATEPGSGGGRGGAPTPDGNGLPA